MTILLDPDGALAQAQEADATSQPRHRADPRYWQAGDPAYATWFLWMFRQIYGYQARRPGGRALPVQAGQRRRLPAPDPDLAHRAAPVDARPPSTWRWPIRSWRPTWRAPTRTSCPTSCWPRPASCWPPTSASARTTAGRPASLPDRGGHCAAPCPGRVRSAQLSRRAPRARETGGRLDGGNGAAAAGRRAGYGTPTPNTLAASEERASPRGPVRAGARGRRRARPRDRTAGRLRGRALRLVGWPGVARPQPGCGLRLSPWGGVALPEGAPGAREEPRTAAARPAREASPLVAASKVRSRGHPSTRNAVIPAGGSRTVARLKRSTGIELAKSPLRNGDDLREGDVLAYGARRRRSARSKRSPARST